MFYAMNVYFTHKYLPAAVNAFKYTALLKSAA